MRVAFLGLGNMGSGMAQRLLEAGHEVRVWNRSPAKMVPLEKAGAQGCASPAAAVEGMPLVISSLMDDASIRELCEGPEGLLARMAPRAIHLCVTTISPSCADWLAAEHPAHGSRYVSGPVLGRPDAAAAGTLIQFLAGDEGAVSEVQPLCAAFTSSIVPIPGPARIANQQKLCMNFAIIALIEVMSESFTLAEKTGASRAIMAGFFERTFANPALKGYAARLAAREIDGTGGFSMRGGYKDVGLMLDAAHEVGSPLEIAEIIRGKMQECLGRGLSEADWSAIQEATRARAGLDAKGSPG